MKLKVCGKTNNDKLVLSGYFKLYDAHGIPLELIFNYAKEEGYVLSVDSFFIDAIKAGWKKDRIINLLKDVLLELHGPIHQNEILEKLFTFNKALI